MRITSFGLFWRASEIEWEPGAGNKDTFNLLGRIGANTGTLRICDFRRQRGIYILYNDYGPYYVGLTRNLGLGSRLKSHFLHNERAGKWDRFSWFGFKGVASSVTKKGILSLEDGIDEVTSSMNTTIGDLEALLIAAMGTQSNKKKESFAEAERWTQIAWEEQEEFLFRVKKATIS